MWKRVQHVMDYATLVCFAISRSFILMIKSIIYRKAFFNRYKKVWLCICRKKAIRKLMLKMCRETFPGFHVFKENFSWIIFNRSISVSFKFNVYYFEKLLWKYFFRDSSVSLVLNGNLLRLYIIFSLKKIIIVLCLSFSSRK